MSRARSWFGRTSVGLADGRNQRIGIGEITSDGHGGSTHPVSSGVLKGQLRVGDVQLVSLSTSVASFNLGKIQTGLLGTFLGVVGGEISVHLVTVDEGEPLRDVWVQGDGTALSAIACAFIVTVLTQLQRSEAVGRRGGVGRAALLSPAS